MSFAGQYDVVIGTGVGAAADGGLGNRPHRAAGAVVAVAAEGAEKEAVGLPGGGDHLGVLVGAGEGVAFVPDDITSGGTSVVQPALEAAV